MNSVPECDYHSPNYAKPMPWIGYYIAAASMVCLLAMIADFISSLMWKQRWTSSRYLSMNAVSLTIFGIAIKLSTDLTTAMPRVLDQVAKLSTSLFICVVVSNSIPSLAKMNNHQATTNILALAILIITSVVDLCIQLVTGVIFVFMMIHILLIVFMLFLLTLCGVAAISLASIKDYLQVIHEKQHRRALEEFESDDTKVLTEKLKDYLTKFSIMAQSGCPLSVLTRSATWSIVLESLSAVVVLFLILGYWFELFYRHDCFSPEHDYEGSVGLIASTQALVALLGIIPKTRKTYTLPKSRDTIRWRVTRTISIGNYLIQSLIEMKENQFFLHIHNGHCKKVMEGVKNAFFYFFIVIYCVVIFVDQVIYFFWAFCFRIVSLPIICCYQSLISCYRSLFNRVNNDDADHLNSLKPYVLHLVGEEETVDQLLSHCWRTTQSYLERGRKKQPDLLIVLLSEYLSPDFNGVFNFDSARVPPLLDSQLRPSNCWTLPLVTLTSIAVALPKFDHRAINMLLLSVSEGLLYVNQIEDFLNDRNDMIYVKKASKIVWKGVNLHRKWLDVDLVAPALQRSNPREVLKFLADSAKAKFLKSRESIQLMSGHDASVWSAKEVATHSMYRISNTLLLDYIDEGNDYRQSIRMFDKLAETISDILGACLTNLRCLILKQCAQSSIEKRKETAFHILDLFGKTESIVEILENRNIPELSSDQLAFIDEWRSYHGGMYEFAQLC